MALCHRQGLGRLQKSEEWGTLMSVLVVRAASQSESLGGSLHFVGPLLCRVLELLSSTALSRSLFKSQSSHLEIGLGMLDSIIIQKMKCVPSVVLSFLSIRHKKGRRDGDWRPQRDCFPVPGNSRIKLLNATCKWTEDSGQLGGTT